MLASSGSMSQVLRDATSRAIDAYFESLEGYQSALSFGNIRAVGSREYRLLYKEVRRLYREIIAFDMMLTNQDRAGVLISLRDEEFWDVQDVLVVWAWMEKQRELIERGEIFNEPFLCSVGDREGRKNIDREYWVLREFIRPYSLQMQKKYLYMGKGENPDFHLCDENNKLLGIEVTEAPRHTIGLEKYGYTGVADLESSDEALEEELFKKSINQVCRIKNVVVNIYGRSDWKQLNTQIDKVLEWMCTEAIVWRKSGRGNERRVFRSDTAALSIWFSEGGRVGIDMSEPLTSGRADEIMCANSILYSINKKESKRNPPNITPSVLVVYPNTRRGDEQYVSEIVIESLRSVKVNHYNEIWMVTEKITKKLY